MGRAQSQRIPLQTTNPFGALTHLTAGLLAVEKRAKAGIGDLSCGSVLRRPENLRERLS
jgi:hypothetical protein